MRNNKYLIPSIIVVIIWLILIFLIYRSGRPDPSFQDSSLLQNINTGPVSSSSPAGSVNPDGSTATGATITLADQSAFEVYLRQNIHDLSPEREVLGGTFYITSVIWQEDNSAIIEYEDGHIGLKAKVVVAYVDATKNKIEVKSFDIIN